MTWFKSLGIGEIFLIGLFVLFYASYLIRVIRVARVLQSDYKTVFVKLILRSTYFALLIIALLGPSFGETSKEVQSEGNDVVSQLEPKTLKSLALRTGGKYFEINQNRNDTDRLINTINGIEGELRESRQLNASDNKYYYFLALGLLLMSLDMVINLTPIRI